MTRGRIDALLIIGMSGRGIYSTNRASVAHEWSCVSNKHDCREKFDDSTSSCIRLFVCFFIEHQSCTAGDSVGQAMSRMVAAPGAGFSIFIRYFRKVQALGDISKLSFCAENTQLTSPTAMLLEGSVVIGSLLLYPCHFKTNFIVQPEGGS